MAEPSGPEPEEGASDLMRRLAARGPAEQFVDGGEIARGGMGTIRLIWDTDLRRELAMKVLRERPGKSDSHVRQRVVARFLDEAQVTAQLAHPGIPPVHNLGVDERGALFFTMPLVRGDELGAIFAKVRAGTEEWTLTRAVGVIARVCEAMAYAHSKGVVHRDLKPSNIMVGEFGQVYVMDWGLARVLGREDVGADEPARESGGKDIETTRRDATESGSSSHLATLDGEVVGTPAYMSPEQARGRRSELGPASDVYSTGAILYHLLSGRESYGNADGSSRSAHEVLIDLIGGPPLHLSTIAPRAPEELIAICDKAMQRDPLERYPDMPAMEADLRAYLEGRVVAAFEAGAWAEFRKWVVRNRELAATVLAALIALVGILGWASWRQRRANDVLAESNDLLSDTNERFAATNAELSRANSELEESRAALVEKSEEAEAARVAAQRASEEAEHRTYAAQLAAAALYLAEGNMAPLRRALEEAPVRLRGWEWHHLSLHEDPSLASAAFFERPTAVALFPRSELLAVGGAHGVVTIFDLRRGTSRPLDHAHTSAVTAIATTPVGRRLVTGARDGSLVLFGGRVRGPIEFTTRHAGGVVGASFTVDGRLLVTAGGEKRALQIGGIPAERGGGDSDGEVRVFDALTGALLAEYPSPAGGVRAMALAGASDSVVTLGTDGVVRVLGLNSGAELRNFPGFRGSSGLAVSRDRTHVAAAQLDAVVLIEVDTGENQRIVARGGPITALAIEPDGQGFFVGRLNGLTEHWSPGTEGLRRIGTQSASVVSIQLDASSGHVTSVAEDGTIKVWDRTPAPAVTVASPAAVVPLVHGEGRVRRDYQPDPVHKVEVRGAADSDVDASERMVLSSLAAVGGDVIAQRGTSRRLQQRFDVDLWDYATGAPRGTLRGHKDRILALGVAPNGAQVATSSRDGSTRLWRTSDLGLERLLPDLGEGVACLEYAPLEARPRRLGIGTERGRIYILDLESGTRTECQGEHRGGITALAWSPDGQMLASGGRDDLVRLWHGGSGRALGALAGHKAAVSALAFHPNGGRIFSGGEDASIRIWDPARLTSLVTLPALPAAPRRLGFQLGGRRLVAGLAGDTPEVYVFDTHHADARGLVRAR